MLFGAQMLNSAAGDFDHCDRLLLRVTQCQHSYLYHLCILWLKIGKNPSLQAQISDQPTIATEGPPTHEDPCYDWKFPAHTVLVDTNLEDLRIDQQLFVMIM